MSPTKTNEDCIVLKDVLLFRQYYGETQNFKYHRIVIPKQLMIELLRSRQARFGDKTDSAKKY